MVRQKHIIMIGRERPGRGKNLIAIMCVCFFFFFYIKNTTLPIHFSRVVLDAARAILEKITLSSESLEVTHPIVLSNSACSRSSIHMIHSRLSARPLHSSKPFVVFEIRFNESS